jgi:hypothetical protein
MLGTVSAVALLSTFVLAQGELDNPFPAPCIDTEDEHLPPVRPAVWFYPAADKPCAYIVGWDYYHKPSWQWSCPETPMASLGKSSGRLSFIHDATNQQVDHHCYLGVPRGPLRFPLRGSKTDILFNDGTLYDCGTYALICRPKNVQVPGEEGMYPPPSYRGFNNTCNFKAVDGQWLAICSVHYKEDQPKMVQDVVFPFKAQPKGGGNMNQAVDEWVLSYVNKQIQAILATHMQPTLHPDVGGLRKCFLAPAPAGAPLEWSFVEHQDGKRYSLYCTNGAGNFNGLPKPDYIGQDNLCFWQDGDESPYLPTPKHDQVFPACLLFEEFNRGDEQDLHDDL